MATKNSIKIDNRDVFDNAIEKMNEYNYSYSENDCFYKEGLDENYDTNIQSVLVKNYNGNLNITENGL